MASREQKRLMTVFQDSCLFEFMGAETVRAKDHTGFLAQWDYNIQWLRDHIRETDMLANEYRLKHLED